ncbi:MAG: hypothetical protein A4E54_01239 [Pelotomaculum sp. PtaB.Bin117]|nr:MAG: hypothetical protein A4E54_01239 [Pelotomaculum sp. PtaB.Bin117]
MLCLSIESHPHSGRFFVLLAKIMPGELTKVESTGAVQLFLNIFVALTISTGIWYNN